MEKLAYTPEEILQLLPISKNTCYRLLESGVIPSIRLGRRFAIPKTAFEQWLNTCGGQIPGPVKQ